MPALAPIAPFLALIDRLISLLKRREIKRREYFDKVIDPLYMEFKPLAEDYLKLFRDAREAVTDSKKTKRAAAADSIAKKREEFAATRARLHALLEVCEQHAVKKKEDELARFVASMARFFRPQAQAGRRSLGEHLVTIFEDWRFNHPGVQETLERYIDSATSYLEASWYEIAGRYMALRIKSLGE